MRSADHLGARVVHVCISHNEDDGRVRHQFCEALHEAGYEVHLIASKPVHPVVTPFAVHHVRADPSRIRRVVEAWLIAFRVRRLQPAVVHVHEPVLLGPITQVCRRSKIVWDVHEDYLAVAQTRYWIPERLRTPLARWWEGSERRSVKRCQAVTVAVPAFIARYRTMSADVVLLRNFPNVRPERSRDPDLPPTAIYTGTILDNRGLEQAIEAIGIARDKGHEIRFEIAGPCDDGYIDVLKTKAAERGVSDLVSFHGRLSRTDALALQNRGTIGLVPHLPEISNLNAWSVKMIEFMEASLPLVYSNLPAHREIVENNVVGIEVDPERPTEIAEALIALSDPAVGRSLGLEGRRVAVERLNWSTEKLKLVELYERILDR